MLYVGFPSYGNVKSRCNLVGKSFVVFTIFLPQSQQELDVRIELTT